jgi:hypothetical protein
MRCRAVVAVARSRSANCDDQPCIGVDDDLVVGGVPIVFRLLCHRMVTCGYQGAFHDEHGVLAEPSARPQCEPRCDSVDDAVGRRLRDSDSAASRRIVKLVRQ